MGGAGVVVTAGGTVTNAGVISGGSGADAVRFAAGFANRLAVAPGATFTGLVNGGNAAGSSFTSTLELAPGAGNITGLGTQFINFAALQIDAGASWTIGIAAPATFSATIFGLDGDDTLHLVGAAPTGVLGTNLLAGNILNVTSGGTSVANLQLDPAQSFAGHTFLAVNDTAVAGITVLLDRTGLSIAALNAVQTEGNAGTKAFTFAIARSGVTTGATTAAWALTGSGPNPANAQDFAGGVLPSGTVSFAVGETSQTITINVSGDTLGEPDESFELTISAPSNGALISTATASGTINDDETAYLSLAALSAVQTEGNADTKAFTFGVSRSGDTTGTTTAAWALIGSGTNQADAQDFAGGVLPSGTVNFAAGETSQTLTINVSGGTAIEFTEGFELTLSSPSNGALITTAAAFGTITDDDRPPNLVANPDFSSPENVAWYTTIPSWTGHTQGNLQSGPFLDSVELPSGITSAGVVQGGSVTQTLYLTPGQTYNFSFLEHSRYGYGEESVTVSIGGATVVDAHTLYDQFERNTPWTLQSAVFTAKAASEDLVFSVTGGDSALFTAVRIAPIANATLSIAALSADKPEGTGTTTPFTFTVTRTGGTTGATTAGWAVTGGTLPGTLAANGADFAAGALPTGNVAFAVGETSKTVTVNVVADAAGDLNESFLVTLSTAQAGTTIGTATATGVILNDDTSLAVAPATLTKAEGNAGTTTYIFTVGRAGTTTGTSSVNWAVAGTGAAPANAADFTGGVLPAGSLAFAAGETIKTITINVAGDTQPESNETFTLALSNPTGAAITAPTAIATILNDDATLSITPLSANKPEGTGTTTPFTFTVTRTGDTTKTHTAKWSTAGTTGTGTQPADAKDFAGGILPSGTVSFAIGETTKLLTINVAADQAGELNERFAVTLAAPSPGATITTATAGAVIVNDDTSLAITPATIARAEGNTGTNAFTYTVQRSGTLSATTKVDWTLTPGGVGGTNPVNAADFTAATLPPGATLTFAPGQTSQKITLAIAADTAPELNESFTLTLSNPTGGVNITTAVAKAVILDDDTIYGTPGNNTLIGTPGRDLFVIGQGQDSITGGLGLDTFRFLPTALGPAATNAFTFEDFSRADGEKLDLSRIDAIPGGLDDPFTFIGTAPFNGTLGQLRCTYPGFRLIEADTNGDLIADLTIVAKASLPPRFLLAQVDANWFVL